MGADSPTTLLDTLQSVCVDATQLRRVRRIFNSSALRGIGQLDVRHLAYLTPDDIVNVIEDKTALSDNDIDLVDEVLQSNGMQQFFDLPVDRLLWQCETVEVIGRVARKGVKPMGGAIAVTDLAQKVKAEAKDTTDWGHNVKLIDLRGNGLDQRDAPQVLNFVEQVLQLRVGREPVIVDLRSNRFDGNDESRKLVIGLASNSSVACVIATGQRIAKDVQLHRQLKDKGLLQKFVSNLQHCLAKKSACTTSKDATPSRPSDGAISAGSDTANDGRRDSWLGSIGRSVAGLFWQDQTAHSAPAETNRGATCSWDEFCDSIDAPLRDMIASSRKTFLTRFHNVQTPADVAHSALKRAVTGDMGTAALSDIAVATISCPEQPVPSSSWACVEQLQSAPSKFTHVGIFAGVVPGSSSSGTDCAKTSNLSDEEKAMVDKRMLEEHGSIGKVFCIDKEARQDIVARHQASLFTEVVQLIESHERARVPAHWQGVKIAKLQAGSLQVKLVFDDAKKAADGLRELNESERLLARAILAVADSYCQSMLLARQSSYTLTPLWTKCLTCEAAWARPATASLRPRYDMLYVSLMQLSEPLPYDRGAMVADALRGLLTFQCRDIWHLKSEPLMQYVAVDHSCQLCPLQSGAQRCAVTNNRGRKAKGAPGTNDKTLIPATSALLSRLGPSVPGTPAHVQFTRNSVTVNTSEGAFLVLACWNTDVLDHCLRSLKQQLLSLGIVSDLSLYVVCCDINKREFRTQKLSSLLRPDTSVVAL